MEIILIGVGRVEKHLLERLKVDSSKVFHKKIVIGKDMPEPDYAFDKRRKQYLSSAILDSIMQEKEFTPFERVLGVTDHDLYAPGLNFVFGQAALKVALISLTRLKQQYYGLPENPHIFQRRIITEAVHELGHTYGLDHCQNPDCVMFFSNSLMDTDRKGYQFCPQCREKLKVDRLRG